MLEPAPTHPDAAPAGWRLTVTNTPADGDDTPTDPDDEARTDPLRFTVVSDFI